MKTTIELSDALFEEAKSAARARGVTLRSLVEQGLRWAVLESRQPRPAFHLRDGSVGGEGLATDADWPEIRSMIYEGHGG
jgi:hypothetical protein